MITAYFSYNGSVDAINEKDQKLKFCGLGEHHQKEIIDNKHKILTTGARTLLLQGTITWPQMINKKIWIFVKKAVAKSLNSLEIDLKSRITQYILHGPEVEYIPVKY